MAFARSLLLITAVAIFLASPALSFSHDSHGATSSSRRTRAPWTPTRVRPTGADDAAAMPTFTRLHPLHAKRVSGVGGMEKNKTGGQRAKTGVKAKKNVKSVQQSKTTGNPESNIDWGKLIVAFLTPWVSHYAVCILLCSKYSDARDCRGIPIVSCSIYSLSSRF